MKLRFKILQIKDVMPCSYIFRPWELAKHKFSLADYKVVYEGEDDFNTNEIAALCEIIFRKFNIVGGDDCKRLNEIGYKGRSLNVSDIIIFDEEDDTLHYVDVFGFQTLRKGYEYK